MSRAAVIIVMLSLGLLLAFVSYSRKAVVEVSLEKMPISTSSPEALGLFQTTWTSKLPISS